MVHISGEFDIDKISYAYDGSLFGISIHTQYKLESFEELIDEFDDSKTRLRVIDLNEKDFICLRKVEYRCKTYKYNSSKELDVSNIKDNIFTYNSSYIPQNSGKKEMKIGIIMKNSNDEYKTFLIDRNSLYSRQLKTIATFSFDYNNEEKTNIKWDFGANNESYKKDESSSIISGLASLVGIYLIIYSLIMIKKDINKKKKS